MQIIPRGKNVLVRRDEAKGKVSKYGIMSPQNVEEEQKAYGTVVNAGAAVNDLKKGDYVIYGAYAGEDIEVDEEGKKIEYKILDEEDIIAFIKK